MATDVMVPSGRDRSGKRLIVEGVVPHGDGLAGNLHPITKGQDAIRQLFKVARLPRPCTGERRNGRSGHRLYAFLTIEAKEVVRPVHPKARPVPLTSPSPRSSGPG